MSKRQRSIVLSLIYAEIISAYSNIKKVAWIKKLTIDINNKNITDQSLYLPILFTDNISEIDWFKNAKINKKSKYIKL